MDINERIENGLAYRVWDPDTEQWVRKSFWHDAQDVEFSDGKNAEDKLGGINGITDSTESAASDIAASAKSVNTLKQKLIGSFTYTENTIEEAVSLIIDEKYLGNTGFISFDIRDSSNERYHLDVHLYANGAAIGTAHAFTANTVYTLKREAGADAVLKKLGSISSYGSLIRIGSLNTSINAASILAEYGIAKEDIKQSNFLIQPTGGSWSGYINGNRDINGGMFKNKSVSYNSSTGKVSTSVTFYANGSQTEESQPSTVTHSFAISASYSGTLWYYTGE